MSYSLCCISNILKSKGVGFSTMTKKRFLQLPRTQAIQEVSKRTLQNVQTTLKTLEHCHENSWNYRVSCNLFPLLSLPEAQLVYEQYPDYIEIERTLNQCSNFVNTNNIRISNHPDQFVVLASDSDAVVKNSIRELELNAWIMDKLGAQKSYFSPINIHINKNADSTLVQKKLLTNLDGCSESVRSRLVLENEDKGMWNVQQIVEMFGKHLPITYDNLHDSCNPCDATGQKAFEICYETWNNRNIVPLFHYSESNPNTPNNKRAHAETPTSKPNSYNHNVDWEIELKGKDYALLQLRENI